MKPVYKADDGSEHKSKKLAEARNNLVSAKRAFEDACKSLNRCMAEEATTADGEPFQFGGFNRYWIIRGGFHGMPSLARVGFWPWHCYVEADRYDGPAIRIREFTNHDNKNWACKFSELYANKANAIAALKAAIAKRLEELGSEAEDALKEAETR